MVRLAAYISNIVHAQFTISVCCVWFTLYLVTNNAVARLIRYIQLSPPPPIPPLHSPPPPPQYCSSFLVALYLYYQCQTRQAPTILKPLGRLRNIKNGLSNYLPLSNQSWDMQIDSYYFTYDSLLLTYKTPCIYVYTSRRVPLRCSGLTPGESLQSEMPI